jgi:ATP/maltotriose-dependent transcriptional regulator MalT
VLARRGAAAIHADHAEDGPERDLEQANVLLREAESVVEGVRAHRDVFVRIRGWRAWGEYLKGNPDQAIRLAEPVYVRVFDEAGIDARVRIELIRPLATAYKTVGDLEAAARLSSEIIENHRRMYGETSLSHVVSLGNSIDLEHFLGRLLSAESRARRVIALYDRIFEPEHPTAYRAVARSHLATTLLHAGRFDEARAMSETLRRQANGDSKPSGGPHIPGSATRAERKAPPAGFEGGD